MKKILATAFAFGTLGASAFAADIQAPTFIKAPPEPVYNWSGFYAGLNIGYGVSAGALVTENTYSGAGTAAALPAAPVGTPLYGGPAQFDPNVVGWNGGAQIGYNFQVSPIWLLGAETDFQGAGMHGHRDCIIPCGAPTQLLSSGVGPPTVFTTNNYAQSIDWFGTLRGRFGYTFGPNLLYVTGGLAYGEVERSGAVAGNSVSVNSGNNLNSFSGSFSTSSTQVGWTIGGGLEAKLWGNWSAKAEYLYVDLGSVSDTFNTVFAPEFRARNGAPGSIAAVRTDSVDVVEHIFRVGVNYQFTTGVW